MEHLSNAEIKFKVKKNLSSARYLHSEGVGLLASQLARRHGWDFLKAERAGFLHDWAKEWSPSRLIRFCRARRLRIPGFSFIIKNSPNLLHAYVGARWVKEKKWIQDISSLRAISSHTLGNMNMSLPEKIIFVSDLAAPDRKFKEAPRIREMAFQNLNQAFLAALSIKMEYQIKKNKPIHPYALQMWNKWVGARP